MFAAVDFETQSLSQGLVRSGFALDQPAVVSWIGVTMYLGRESIEATLDAIARCAPGTRVVLSYDQPPDVIDEKGRGLLAEVSGTAAREGEPFITLLRQDEVDQLLVAHGFDSVAHFGAEEAVVGYFGGNDVGVPDVQRLVTAVIARFGPPLLRR